MTLVKFRYTRSPLAEALWSAIVNGKCLSLFPNDDFWLSKQGAVCGITPSTNCNTQTPAEYWPVSGFDV
ncbi:MAG: hypothetical protein ACI9AH_000516, partial [Oceanospirillaceae bacterium]